VLAVPSFLFVRKSVIGNNGPHAQPAYIPQD
jgi:hypothetical protein